MWLRRLAPLDGTVVSLKLQEFKWAPGDLAALAAAMPGLQVSVSMAVHAPSCIKARARPCRGTLWCVHGNSMFCHESRIPHVLAVAVVSKHLAGP